jgi:PBP1b-binding outer membrane lipoprotein LpoB
MLATRLSHFLRVTLLAALLAIVGCQSAPVQEMSDARQAITVAQKAGAEELAPSDLKAAMDYLQSAEGFINQRKYDMARRDAVNAKASALDALRLSSSDQP